MWREKRWWRQQTKKNDNFNVLLSPSTKNYTKMPNKMWEASLCFAMVKTKEYSQDERVASKYLREAGHSYAEIARQVGCSKSTAHYIYKSLERTGSVKKGARTGRPKKISERGERIVCRASRQLRYSTLRELKSTVTPHFSQVNPSTYLVKRILRKYGIRSCLRKRKPYVSQKNRSYRRHWSRGMLEWPLENWNDIIFSNECRFGLKNDSGVLRVWRTSNEANNPEFFQPTFTNSVSVMV